MAIEPAGDAVRRLRLELRAIVDDLERQGASPTCVDTLSGAQAHGTRLREIAVELRRIAARGVTPDSRRDAEALAALVQDVTGRLEQPPIKRSD